MVLVGVLIFSTFLILCFQLDLELFYRHIKKHVRYLETSLICSFIFIPQLFTEFCGYLVSSVKAHVSEAILSNRGSFYMYEGVSKSSCTNAITF